jgi:Flp pilus assembly secretin CpaC
MDHTTPLAALFALTALASGCAQARFRPLPTATEFIGLPGRDPVRTLRLHVGEAASLVEQVVLIEAGNADLVRAYAQDETLTLVARTLGTTELRLVGREGESSSLRIEVTEGEPSSRALFVGDTLVVPMKAVKEYSVGLPGIVAVMLTSDGSQLVVTGRKAGVTTLVSFDAKGISRSTEVVVVGGQRVDLALSPKSARRGETL